MGSILPWLPRLTLGRYFIYHIDHCQTSLCFATQVTHKQADRSLRLRQKRIVCPFTQEIDQSRKLHDGDIALGSLCVHATTCLSVIKRCTNSTKADTAPGTPRNPGK